MRAHTSQKGHKLIGASSRSMADRANDPPSLARPREVTLAEPGSVTAYALNVGRLLLPAAAPSCLGAGDHGSCQRSTCARIERTEERLPDAEAIAEAVQRPTRSILTRTLSAHVQLVWPQRQMPAAAKGRGRTTHAFAREKISWIASSSPTH